LPVAIRRYFSSILCRLTFCSLFCFTDPATTAIYTLSLHDALPISQLHDLRVSGPHGPHAGGRSWGEPDRQRCGAEHRRARRRRGDRKSTRLNSSHQIISYAVFCLKKKKKKRKNTRTTHRRISK